MADQNSKKMTEKAPANLPAMARLMRATKFAREEEALITGKAHKAEEANVEEKLAAA